MLQGNGLRFALTFAVMLPLGLAVYTHLTYEKTDTQLRALRHQMSSDVAALDKRVNTERAVADALRVLLEAERVSNHALYSWQRYKTDAAVRWIEYFIKEDPRARSLWRDVSERSGETIEAAYRRYSDNIPVVEKAMEAYYAAMPPPQESRPEAPGAPTKAATDRR